MILIIHHVLAVQFNTSLSERGLRSERNLLRVRAGTNVFLLFNAHLGGHKLQMLQWSDTDKLLLLQFKEGHTGVTLQRRRFLLFVRLRLINEQDGRCIKLWPSMHWEDFCERRVELRGWTPYVRSVCQVGDRTSPVTGYMSRNKNYSSRLKRRRCSHPSQIVCEYEPQNVAAESWSRARAAGGPTLAGCLYPAVFMVGGFFTWLTFNCMRSNISSSKRGIKMDS